MEKVGQIAWFLGTQMENEPRMAALVMWRHTEVHSFLGASVASLHRPASLVIQPPDSKASPCSLPLSQPPPGRGIYFTAFLALASATHDS